MNSLIRSGLLVATLVVSVSAVAAELETDDQKLGYLIGMDIGKSLLTNDTEVDIDALIEAIRTVYTGGEPAMTQDEAQAVREEFMARRQAVAAAEQAEVADQNKAAGDAFLATNAKAAGVVVTASGLQYKVERPADGARPAATDTVTVHYRGTLLDGTEFDSSYARGEPISFPLNQVIPGWTEGVQLMPVGSKYTFWIKPELAYGTGGGGRIPPQSTLTFEVELLGIEGQ